MGNCPHRGWCHKTQKQRTIKNRLLFIVVPILLQLSVFQPFFARFFPPQKPGSMIREVRKFGETPGQLAERIRSNTANAKVRHGEERVPLFSQKMAMTWMIFLSDVFYDIFWLDWKFWKFGLSCFFFFKGIISGLPTRSTQFEHAHVS